LRVLFYEQEHTMQQVIERATEILQQLGELEDEYAIGAFLEAEGASGRKGDITNCVLAKFLMRKTGVMNIHVVPNRTTIGDTKISNPPRLISFLALFDEGHFPRLDESYQAPPPGQIITVSGAMMPYLRPWVTGNNCLPLPETGVLQRTTSQTAAKRSLPPLLTARESMVLELLQSLPETCKETSDASGKPLTEGGYEESTLTRDSLAVLC
jgi:hypothetical protein